MLPCCGILRAILIRRERAGNSQTECVIPLWSLDQLDFFIQGLHNTFKACYLQKGGQCGLLLHAVLCVAFLSSLRILLTKRAVWSENWAHERFIRLITEVHYTEISNSSSSLSTAL